MNALSISITFLLLWVLLAMGVIMVVISLRRLLTYRAMSPVSLPSRDTASRKRRLLPLSTLLLVLGLFFAFWGVFGTYNLIWVG